MILLEVQIRETIYYDQLLKPGARGATLRHSCGLLTTPGRPRYPEPTDLRYPNFYCRTKTVISRFVTRSHVSWRSSLIVILRSISTQPNRIGNFLKFYLLHNNVRLMSNAIIVVGNEIQIERKDTTKQPSKLIWRH